MNAGQSQVPQLAPGQMQGQQGAHPQQRPPAMYQPKQIRNMPMLSEDEKSKYEIGLRNLWNKVNGSPANSVEQLGARQKIQEFSRMLTSKIQQHHSQSQQAQQQGQQNPSQVSAGSRPPNSMLITQGPSQVQPQAPPQRQPQQQQQQLKQEQANPAGGVGATNDAPTPASSQAQKPAGISTTSTAGIQRQPVPSQYHQAASKVNIQPPPHLLQKSPAQAAKWVEDIKDRYARALFTAENSKNTLKAMEKLLQDRIDMGRPFSEDEMAKYQMRKEQQTKSGHDATKWVETVRKQQEGLQAKNSQTSQTIAGTTAAAPGGRQVESTQGAAAQVAQNKAQQAALHADAAKKQQQQQQQMAAANRVVAGATQAQTQVQTRPAQGAGPAGQQQPASHPRPDPVAERVQPAPSSVPPPLALGQARALSHSAAISRANQNKSIGNSGGTPALNQPPQPSVSTPTSATGTTNPVNMPPQGESQAHPTQLQAGIVAKMPIPKQLPEKVTAIPTGVTLGGGVSAGRPTLSQGTGVMGGMLNQAPVARVPAYNHDAEGDHVLNKKKLDELVRQVCGSSAEGQHDGNLLSPEVEEHILTMADSFVDNVLHAACRNSKERGSKVLEIRDIQLVLERTYNIRVPGYSSDELRTVRKVQPAPGWMAKMSAVQAAKVMPGKGET